MGKCTTGWIGRWTEGWIDGRVDGSGDGWMGGGECAGMQQMGIWDRQANRQTFAPSAAAWNGGAGGSTGWGSPQAGSSWHSTAWGHGDPVATARTSRASSVHVPGQVASGVCSCEAASHLCPGWGSLSRHLLPSRPRAKGRTEGGGVSVWDLDLQPSHLTRLCVLRCPHPNHHCTPTTIVPRSPLHSLQILPLPIGAVITSDCCRGNARGAFPLQAGAVTLIPIFPLGNRADVPVQTCVGFFCVRAHRCAFSSRLCTPVRLLQPFAEMLLSVRSLMSRHGGVN